MLSIFSFSYFMDSFLGRKFINYKSYADVIISLQDFGHRIPMLSVIYKNYIHIVPFLQLLSAMIVIEDWHFTLT